MIKYQILSMRFDQVSDHKHDILAAIMFTKSGPLLFFSSMISEVPVRKTSKQTLSQVEKETAQKLKLVSIAHLPASPSQSKS